MAISNRHERHFVYLDSAEQGEYGWKYIDQYQKFHQLKNRGEAIEALLREHQEMKNQLLGNKALVESITSQIKKLIDPIRLRTGSTERSVAMFRELLNGFIVLHGMEEQFPVMDVQSDAIVRADEKIADTIKAQQVYRNSDKYKRLKRGE
jgi:hypothetical protein